VKIYVAAVQALMKMETQDETQFTMKIGGKPSLGPSYFLLWNFHSQLRVWCPVCRNWPFSPPNRLTLWITLLKKAEGSLTVFK
jgi:hypothetical protein